MAILKHHSYDENKIRRYKYFKDISNNDILNIRTKEAYKTYLNAIEKNVITDFNIQTNTGFFIRIDCMLQNIM